MEMSKNRIYRKIGLGYTDTVKGQWCKSLKKLKGFLE